MTAWSSRGLSDIGFGSYPNIVRVVRLDIPELGEEFDIDVDLSEDDLVNKRYYNARSNFEIDIKGSWLIELTDKEISDLIRTKYADEINEFIKCRENKARLVRENTEFVKSLPLIFNKECQTITIKGELYNSPNIKLDVFVDGFWVFSTQDLENITEATIALEALSEGYPVKRFWSDDKAQKNLQVSSDNRYIHYVNLKTINGKRAPYTKQFITKLF